MEKIRFVIVGSGWRSLFYARIARRIPERFELAALFCRSQEKADKIAKEEGIHTTISIEDCLALKPDFVVVAVNKSSIADVSLEWLKRGCTVLCETPVAFSQEQIKNLEGLPRDQKSRLFVAEQYRYFMENQALLALLDKNLIGPRHFANISLTNDHHAASLIRLFLGEPVSCKWDISKKTLSFPGQDYQNRYQRFRDGRISEKKRGLALYQFGDGKAALYDFDSDQYRSPIRHSYIKIQGERGEIFNDQICWLDKEGNSHRGQLIFNRESVHLDHPNPNLSDFSTTTRVEVKWEGKEESEILVENPWAGHQLSDDECAIAILMKKVAQNKGDFQKENLENALVDAKMALA